MNKVFCDECKHEFLPELKEIKGYQYFRCPSCRHEYPVCRITYSGLKIREKLNKEREKYRRMTSKTHTKQQILEQQDIVIGLEARFKKEFTPLATS